jgi:hypothetical protein
MQNRDISVLLLGTWQLVSVEVRFNDGGVIYPWGQDPVGSLIYTSDGHMSGVISQRERPRFAGEDILEGSPDELAQAARSYLSYGGTYTIRDDVVIHHVLFSLFPNWVGQEQIRYIDAIKDDTLVLRTPPLIGGERAGAGYLIWERAKRMLDSGIEKDGQGRRRLRGPLLYLAIAISMAKKFCNGQKFGAKKA